MIIFDLDGTLSDYEHRRPFIKKSLNGCNHWYSTKNHPVDMCNKCKDRWKKWKPDWKSFYEACDKDKPIIPVLDAFIHLTQGDPFNHDVQIWSGRCESVRKKTLNWLVNLTGYCEDKVYWDQRLKMRPVGDNTPIDQLKEKWLIECIDNELFLKGEIILFVFDSNPDSIHMWRQMDVFVLNCYRNDY